MDHRNKLIQIEDPREQWQQEQEWMSKEYLIVAHEALNAKKIYQIRQQWSELAQEEYQQLYKMCEDNSHSHVSCELRCELTQMKQELQYKEKGVETLQEIDHKMSMAHMNYKLEEAKAIMNELYTIKKAICMGEKERRDLMQSLAQLTDGFKNSFSSTDSLQDFSHNQGSFADPCSPQ